MEVFLPVLSFGLAGIGFAYLVFWIIRWIPTWQARIIANRSVHQPEWSPKTIEDILEYTRFLDVSDPLFSAVAIGLANRGVDDPRANWIYELYLCKGAPISADNVAVARRFAWSVKLEPVNPNRFNLIENAAVLLDAMIANGLATQAELKQRAELTRIWIDTSPRAIAACILFWNTVRSAQQTYESLHELTRFLFDYFSATWQKREEEDGRWKKEIPVEGYKNLTYIHSAADVFCAMADIPPANLSIRQVAAQALFEAEDYRACFGQCLRIREDFGAPALDNQTWLLWGKCIIFLESQNWEAFSHGRFSNLPPGVAWNQLREVLDHACAVQPSDDDLLLARIWTYTGSQIPPSQALGVYESLVDHRLPVTPALSSLLEYYFRNKDWQKVEKTGRFLLLLVQDGLADRVAKTIASALIAGNLSPDFPLFERVFDQEPADRDLNSVMLKYYQGKPVLTIADLRRVGILLESQFNEKTSAEDIQALREKYCLTWLLSGMDLPEGYSSQVEAYLDRGGSDKGIMKWAVEKQVGGMNLQQNVLEELIRQKKVDRRHVLSLANIYSLQMPDKHRLDRLAKACESIWQGQEILDGDDCHLALLIGRLPAVSAASRKKLLVALASVQPDGWKDLAETYLREFLSVNPVDETILRLAIDQIYKPDELNPLHQQVLEQAAALWQEPVKIDLRLLGLYDHEASSTGMHTKEIRDKANRLAMHLAKVCQSLDEPDRSVLFSQLFQRMLGRKPDDIPDWEKDFLVWGTLQELVDPTPASLNFIGQMVDHLMVVSDQKAADLEQWRFRHSMKNEASAVRLFQIKAQTGRLDPANDEWLEIASLAWREPAIKSKAVSFLIDALQQRNPWDSTLAELAFDLLDESNSDEFLKTFIDRVEYTRHRKFQRKMLDMVDHNLALGRGRADLLLGVIERREKNHQYDAALEACLLMEDSVGSSENLTRRILSILPNTRSIAAASDRLQQYLELYPNSFDLLVQLMTLARDKKRPLDFSLAFKIAEMWGELALKPSTQSSYVGDPSFIVMAKCELYENYHPVLTQQQAESLLYSIARHSRAALSKEARQAMEKLGEQVLFEAGGIHHIRQAVAEMMVGLGNLPVAVSHFEQLVEVSEYRSNAVKSLESIARQLESPRREIPSLLTAYACLTRDAFQGGRLADAEVFVRQAKKILVDPAAFDDLDETARKQALVQRDAILKLHQTILETSGDIHKLEDQRKLDLADVYRLRGLWDKAGHLYSDLAKSLKLKNDRSGALGLADIIFECYYKAGKGWWEIAARNLLSILWGHETIPSRDVFDTLSAAEAHLLENVAVLYHSLHVDPNLHLDPLRLRDYKRRTQDIYDRFPSEYIRTHEYLLQLKNDLDRAKPEILEPFDMVPHIREKGHTEIWTGTQYEKIDRLGSGEFAEVFKVKDRQGQIFAMKLIKSAKGRDPKVLQRFQQEGTWLQELDHPNIVKCHDAGVQEDRQFIIMDFVEGQTLDSLIARRRREIPLDTRLRIFLDICSAVEFLHNQGILHRDLHPGNVLVGGTGYEVVKLTDFGLATMMDREGVGKSSRINGRENYTPPEVYERRAETTASEVYSLGAILCFMLTGWTRPDAALMAELRSKEYYQLGEVIDRALSNDPARRYQRVTELIEEIRRRAHLKFDYTAILQRVTTRRFQQLFTLEEKIGEGDSGPVFRAKDLRSPGAPDVAIKEVASDRLRGSLERRAEQFYRIRDLDHPNIVRLHSIFRVDSKVYVVMDLVEGKSLADLMDSNEKTGKRFTPAEVLKYSIDAASGVSFIHEHQIIHGCLVPTNLLVETGGGKVKISDFAGAVLFDGDQWHKSARLREYNYFLAPEIEQNKGITPATDVYSLGLLVSRLATGQRGMLTTAEIFAALEEMGRWSEGQMNGLVELIEGSIILDPQYRKYPDGLAFLRALNQLIE
ncbi:MAG TPA: serine/threonine-protein kinase [Anaerolineaceae bacterium]